MRVPQESTSREEPIAQLSAIKLVVDHEKLGFTKTADDAPGSTQWELLVDGPDPETLTRWMTSRLMMPYVPAECKPTMQNVMSLGMASPTRLYGKSVGGDRGQR